MVVRWISAFLAALVCAGCLASPPGMQYPVHFVFKRSFKDLECKGVYNSRIFAIVDRICADCYDLFREPHLHTLCRQRCFTSPYFKGCVESLLMQDEEEKIDLMVEYLGRK